MVFVTVLVFVFVFSFISSWHAYGKLDPFVVVLWLDGTGASRGPWARPGGGAVEEPLGQGPVRWQTGLSSWTAAA